MRRVPFRRRSAWCWDLEPRIHPDGVVHHVVMADGTYVNGWCLLTAVDGTISGEVLARQWCSRETSAAYKALFEQIAARRARVRRDERHPTGMRRKWRDTRIQRCLVHVQRDTRADLTGKPRLQAGRELKRLADMLTPSASTSPTPPSDGARALNAWHGRWKRMLAERTYAIATTRDPQGSLSRGGWWWTHLPLRRAYFKTRTPLQRRHTLLFPRPRAHDSRPGAA